MRPERFCLRVRFMARRLPDFLAQLLDASQGERIAVEDDAGTVERIGALAGSPSTSGRGQA